MNLTTTIGATFQSDSTSWKLQKFGRQLSEWVEYQLYQLQSPDTPDAQTSVYWPEWLLALLPTLRVVVFWSIVAGLAVWAAWMLYVILLPYIREMRSRRYSVQNRNSPSSELRRSPQQWLQEAQALQKQKRYADACRALYLGMVQQLQDKKFVPQRDSATDGDYRQSVQPLSEAHAYSLLIDTHEQTVFGNAVASEQMAQQCQQAYQEMLDP